MCNQFIDNYFSLIATKKSTTFIEQKSVAQTNISNLRRLFNFVCSQTSVIITQTFQSHLPNISKPYRTKYHQNFINESFKWKIFYEVKYYLRNLLFLISSEHFSVKSVFIVAADRKVCLDRGNYSNIPPWTHPHTRTT